VSDHARLSIAHWVTRVIAAGILVMGALPKLTGGAAELADRLPGGGSVVTAIAIVEILAIVLMFVPRTTRVGSGLATVVMIGAVASHVAGPVGMEGDFATMFVLALVAALSAGAATVIAGRRQTAS